MKAIRLICIALLALVATACGTFDEQYQEPSNTGVQFTATLHIGTPATRALTDNGTTIAATWAVNDEIALIYGSTKDKATVISVSAGVATVSCLMSGTPVDGQAITLCYPYSSVNSTSTPFFNATLVASQDGTLDYISSHLDLRQASGTLSVKAGKATLKEDVDMSKSSMAIWKMNLQNGGVALNAKSLTVSMNGSDLVTVASTGKSEYYLAIPKTSGSVPFALVASDGTNSYEFEKDAVTLAANTFYSSTVPMGKVVNLATIQSDYEAQDRDILTGSYKSPDKALKFTIANGATVTLRDAIISCQVSGVGTNPDYSWAGLTCLGDATLILSGTNVVEGFYEYYPGVFVPMNYTLTIKGAGSLEARSGGEGSGIGSVYTTSADNKYNSGNIVIESGTIEAEGAEGGAGIGSAFKSQCGDITIKGGKVTASSHEYTGGTSAAIGSGGGGKCGNITISGGIVNATGGYTGAGIGAGSNTGSVCGNILINGGTIVSKGGNHGAAGIGCGRQNSTCGTITITSGASVKATKGVDPSIAQTSIGKGWDNDDVCGAVTIGGTVYWDGSAYQNDGGTYLTVTTLTYPAP